MSHKVRSLKKTNNSLSPVTASPPSPLRRERGVISGIPLDFRKHTMVVDNPLSLILKIDK